MGIRVNKCLGYGLANLQCFEGKIIDPRISLKSHLMMPADVAEERYEQADYIKYFSEKENRGDDSYGLGYYQNWTDLGGRWQIWDSIIHQSEMGNPSVLLIVPPVYSNSTELRSWRRHDDMLDYIEEPFEGRVAVLDRALYPWESWQNKEGKKESPDMARALIRQGQFWFPSIPECVQRLCKWANLFVDEKTILELRPMIYVYWS